MTGAHYISADALAHEISARQDVQEEIRAAFGVSERKQLGAIVFADAGKMAQLEGIIHPRVIAATKAQLESTPHAVIDAPLLTEAGMHALCCEVWLVTAADDVRVQRLASRSGMPREEAMRRIHARRGDD
jgi:dephospho-CoA kinase